MWLEVVGVLLLVPPRTKPEQQALLQLACSCKSPGDLIRDLNSDSVDLGWG